MQILFAFLLTIPSSSGSPTSPPCNGTIYLVALMAASMSVIAFTAPVALHRLLFREGLKDFIVRYTGRLIIVGRCRWD